MTTDKAISKSILLKDYRELLRRELHMRQELNAKFSLRDFAKQLGLSASHLCEVLKGKKGISRLKARKITVVLGFGTYSRQCFEHLVSSQSGRSKSEKNLSSIVLKTRPFIPKAFAELETFLQGSTHPSKIIFNGRFQAGKIETLSEIRRILQTTYHGPGYKIKRSETRKHIHPTSTPPITSTR